MLALTLFRSLQDFRNFRVDRMRSLQTLGESFCDEAGKTLAGLLQLVRA